MAGQLLPNLAVSIMADDVSLTPSSFGSIRGNKAMVIDFWHTNCTRCPAGLEKLNVHASTTNGDDIIFISCALSQGEGNHGVAASLVTDGSLESMTHVFMDMDTKEEAKAFFGFTSVPFYVVVDQTGHVIGMGQPPSFDYKKYTDIAVKGPADPVHTLASAVTETIAAKPVHTFTIDEDF